MMQPTALGYAKAIADEHGPDEGNVAMVRMMGVRMISGRVPSGVRRALNTAVKSGRLGHLRRDGSKPEAYFHPNAMAHALEMRDAEARKTIVALCSVMTSPAAELLK